MLKHTEPFTEQRKLALLKSMQVIGLATEIISIEYHDALVDSKFKNANLNNASRLIKQSVQSIKTHMASITNIKDKEFYEYEYSLEIHRLLRLTCGLDISEIQAINNALESELEKEKTVWENV